MVIEDNLFQLMVLNLKLKPKIVVSPKVPRYDWLCLDKTISGHFADDTFLMYNSKNLKTIKIIVNTELNQVSKWLSLNKLSLNADKTDLIYFHSKQHALNYDIISIKFNGIKLFPVDNAKYLGMY